MSFEFFPEESARLAQDAALHPLTADNIDTPAFQGFGNQLLDAPHRGALRVVEAGATLAGGLRSGGGDLESADRAFRVADAMKEARQQVTPEPGEVGWAARLLGGGLEAATNIGLSGGNLYGLGSGAALNAGAALVDEGVSGPAAVAGAEIAGATTAIGFRIPFLGKTLAQRIGFGAASNIGLGAVSDLATKGELSAFGYDTQAANINPWNAEARAMDALTGAMFGGVAHFADHPPTQAEIDAAATLNAHANQTVATAPGIPKDIEALNAHTNAIETALQQVLTDQPVTVGVDPNRFAADPHQVAVQADVRAAVREELGPEPTVRGPSRADEIPRSAEFPPKQRAVETRFSEHLGENLDAEVKRYDTLPESDGGKILSVDSARDLSADYNASKESRSQLAFAVHEPASWFIKKLYELRLAALKPGEHVMFMSGGTGSGKTTAIADVPQVKKAYNKAAFAYDGNLHSFDSAITKIDQALAAGAKVDIVHVQRDPVESLIKGALPRANRQGRTVPLESHLDTHIGSAETIQRLAERYAGNDKVKISVIDNTRGKGQAKASNLAFVKGFDYNGVEEKALSALHNEYATKAINSDIYAAFLGGQPAKGIPVRVSEGDTGGTTNLNAGGEGVGVSASRPGTRAANTSGSEATRTPEITAAEQIVSAQPDLTIPLEDGSVVNAAEAFAAVDAELKTAQELKPGVDALVACVLSHLGA
ncbi:MAG: zeta toxin family protein [Gammaproteobacteria bacterium]|nr:zeta toxin family protein [Gammaproteobacteria bacterium]